MQYGDLFTTTWRLVRKHRGLWIFGLLASLGGLLANLTGRLLFDRLPFLEMVTGGLEGWAIVEALLEPYLLFGSALALFLWGIIAWLASAIADGALITGVAQLDQGEEISLGQLFSAGYRLLGRFVAIDTILFLPLFLLLLTLMIIGAGGFAGLVVAATHPDVAVADLLLVSGIAGAVALPFFCLLIPIALGIAALRLLAFRSAALENLGPWASIRRAWGVLRAKLLPFTGLAILLWALRYLVGLPFRFLGLILLGLGVAMPVMAALDLAGPSPGSRTGLMVASLLVALVAGLVKAVLKAFVSGAWTLSYRQWVSVEDENGGEQELDGSI